MALIAMAVFDTVENKRSKYTVQTLNRLYYTVDFTKHRMVIIDNNSCEETKKFLKIYKKEFHPGAELHILTNETNIGTAEAVNLGWRMRKPGEHAIKMDNDVLINDVQWLDKLEEVITKDSNIGQVGLKRKDCWENPTHKSEYYRSELIMLPHVPGEKWIIVEKSNHIMGTCVLHSSALLDKVGYLYQPRLYGFDDALMSFRSQKAGFYNCFLPQIDIDHIDDGKTQYQPWKEQQAAQDMKAYQECIQGYTDGTKSIYYNPYE